MQIDTYTFTSKNPYISQVLNPAQTELPKAGDFYYHYKHNPQKGVLDYCYQVVGIGLHTETEEKLVVYKPLYQSDYLNNSRFEFFLGR